MSAIIDSKVSNSLTGNATPLYAVIYSSPSPTSNSLYWLYLLDHHLLGLMSRGNCSNKTHRSRYSQIEHQVTLLPDSANRANRLKFNVKCNKTSASSQVRMRVRYKTGKKASECTLTIPVILMILWCSDVF